MVAPSLCPVPSEAVRKRIERARIARADTLAQIEAQRKQRAEASWEALVKGVAAELGDLLPEAAQLVRPADWEDWTTSYTVRLYLPGILPVFITFEQRGDFWIASSWRAIIDERAGLVQQSAFAPDLDEALLIATERASEYVRHEADPF